MAGNRRVVNVDNSSFPGEGFLGFTGQACKDVDASRNESGRSPTSWKVSLADDLRRIRSGAALSFTHLFTTGRQLTGNIAASLIHGVRALQRGIYRLFRASLLVGAMSPVVPFAFGVGSALSLDTDKLPRDKAVNAASQHAATEAYNFVNKSCAQYAGTDCHAAAKAASTLSALGARAYTELDRYAVSGQPDSIISTTTTVKPLAHGRGTVERATRVKRNATQPGVNIGR